MSDVTLQWLLPDGRGVGRAPDGATVRVDGGVPGDVVCTDQDPPRLVRPSPDRRTPPCPWSKRCGGCDLDVLTPGSRHRALAATVAHAFRHPHTPTVVPSPRAEGHRARIKLAIEGTAVGYRPRRSHALVAVQRCRIARPEVQDAHQRLIDWLQRVHPRGLGAVEIRSDGTRVAYAFTSSGSVPRATREALAQLEVVALDGRRIAGDPVLELRIEDQPLRVRPRSFYQVNLELNTLLVAHVRQALVDRGAEAVLDLYAGIGNLSVPLAAAGLPVVAVEAPGPGGEDLRDNAAAARARGLSIEAITQRVERLDPSRIPFDAVVLDPPRAGARGVLPRITRNRPRIVAYISCHAPSAARDLREIPDYELVSLTTFDLFVDTRHLEAVAILERRSRPRR
ncbi:MAG TPA: class I SAM-dependent RNA methyltransferase [Deltaproteobacteria bacterium]|nr:class I SAM-dependent RNA methyltransferase [Deltaproteobacteria bacterium]